MPTEMAKRHRLRWLHARRRDPLNRTDEVNGLTRLKPASDRHQVRARLGAVTRRGLRRPSAPA